MIFLVVTISRDKISLISKNMPSNTQALNTFRSKLRNYYFHYYKPYFHWYSDRKIKMT
jgi:hypothetical protein